MIEVVVVEAKLSTNQSTRQNTYWTLIGWMTASPWWLSKVDLGRSLWHNIFDGITIGLLGFCLGQNVNTIILKSKQARKIFSNQPRVNLSNTNNPLYPFMCQFWDVEN